MRLLASLLALLFVLVAPRGAAAFCGFYVSSADAKLVSRATQVVLMRAGTRTVLSMQNAYEGPPQDFAMVVPVPVVLQKDQVKTLPREVFDHVDQLGAPRLVEYWERDPCAEGIGLGNIGTIGHGSGTGQGFGTGSGRHGDGHVTIEAEFAVAEYEIVILSATDATALDRWLRDNHYKIPDGTEPYLRPYVQAGMKFFVAKVDITKVAKKDGHTVLSPLRFHYDAETFTLPIRLGLISSGDAQDLIVSILAEKQRYEVANYPNVPIPTNLDVTEAARASFGSFYAALFDQTLKRKPGAVVTEYAWDAGSCDPCPGPPLSGLDVATLGGDVLPDGSKIVRSGSPAPPTVRMEGAKVTGRLPPEVIQRVARQNFGRLRLCYEKGLTRNPALQGRIPVHFVIGTSGSVSSTTTTGSSIPDTAVNECVARAFHDLSFPAPEGGIVVVDFPVRFAPGGASGISPGSVVLTRLHMRYTRDALGEDLVFREAGAIVGGREIRDESGALEQVATEATTNNFQARYAIRHPWKGAIACAEPRRGDWGGPPEGQGPATQAARDLAFVPRGAQLASFVNGPLPAIGFPAAASSSEPAPPASAPATAAPAASSAATPATSAAPAPSAGCGCRTAPGESSGAGALLAMTALLGLARRRDGRPKPTESP